MGLTGKKKFDEAMQDRIGEELARQRGLNAKRLSQKWASLCEQKLATTVVTSKTLRHAMPRKGSANSAVNPGRGGKEIDATGEGATFGRRLGQLPMGYDARAARRG